MSEISDVKSVIIALLLLHQWHEYPAASELPVTLTGNDKMG